MLPSHEHRRRWRFQFGLRGVLVLVSVVAIVSAGLHWVLSRLDREARAIAALEPLGSIALDPAGPAWLHKVFGEAPFQRAWSVNLGGKTVDSQALSHLQTLTALHELVLPYTNIDDDTLGQLPKLSRLEKLNLEHTNVSDVGLWRIVPTSRSITCLQLQETQIGGHDTSYLKLLTGLIVLNVSGTRVTDQDLVHISGLSQLRMLQASHTRITDAAMAHLAGLVDLQDLVLDNTMIGDAAMVHIAKLEKLDNLFLNATRITDAGLEHLRSLRHLRVLRMSSTKISYAGLRHLDDLPSLFMLFLEHSEVTATGIEQWLRAQRNKERGVVWGTSGSYQFWETRVTDEGVEIKREYQDWRNKR